MNVPDNLRYASSHEWILVEEDGTALLGITDHAQNELTDIVFVDPPEAGKELESGEVIAVVESVKAASDIYAPVDCEVIESNEALNGDPGLINTDPFGEGWICKVKLSKPDQVETLLAPDAYREQIG